MEPWTALMLGLAGSLHCAGMCGPLALAVPVAGTGVQAVVISRVTYNLGRLATYMSLGLAAGGLGRVLAGMGWQRWVSLAAGVLMLVGVMVSARWIGAVALTGRIAALKRAFGSLLQRRTIPAVFGLGLLNGLLPCGLVYAAAAGAATTGHVLYGGLYMLIFGLGTVPVMLGIGLAGMRLQQTVRQRFQALVPVSLGLVGALLILRGLALDIPYLSPPAASDPESCAFCAGGGE